MCVCVFQRIASTAPAADPAAYSSCAAAGVVLQLAYAALAARASSSGAAAPALPTHGAALLGTSCRPSRGEHRWVCAQRCAARTRPLSLRRACQMSVAAVRPTRSYHSCERTRVPMSTHTIGRPSAGTTTLSAKPTNVSSNGILIRCIRSASAAASSTSCHAATAPATSSRTAGLRQAASTSGRATAKSGPLGNGHGPTRSGAATVERVHGPSGTPKP
mmetsp:Transcript_57374/g.157532  ORF Transcript_57374/g.157532 Transcript_57374/m.157532 type:complete len:218 (+) Transcript_57374:80-733(+)